MTLTLTPEWRSIVAAPRCRASTKDDSGSRPVLVTHFPFTGHHAPVAIARLTVSGWKAGAGVRNLWFEPTHWRQIPEVIETAAIVSLSQLGAGANPRPNGEGAGTHCQHAASRRVVRLHPLPENSSIELADLLGKVIAGAVRSALHAHARQFPRHLRGMLVGSIRKRAVNQLVCLEGETMLRAALEEQGTDGRVEVRT